MSGEAEKVSADDLRKAVETGLSGEGGTTIEGESHEYTEIEQEAMEDGWIPPDRFDKADTGKKFVTAEKYLENGSFFKKINSQKERIEQLEQSQKQLMSHYDKVAENEHKKAEAHYKSIIDDLTAQKAKAIKEGEGDRVVEIEAEIENTEKPVLDAKPEADPIYDAWASENKWYQEDKFLSVEADIVAERYLNKGLRGKDLLDAMTEHMKELHADKFKKYDVDEKDDGKEEKSHRPASVEGDTGGGRSRKVSKNISERDLTSDERDVFKSFDRMGLFKDDAAKSKYFKEVIELRD